MNQKKKEALLQRWIEADEKTLSTHAGQSVPFESITDVDTTRWKNKGIAVVQYEDNGKPGRITLDDWKFDRSATAVIYNRIQTFRGVVEEPAASSSAEPEPQPESETA